MANPLHWLGKSLDHHAVSGMTALRNVSAIVRGPLLKSRAHAAGTAAGPAGKDIMHPTFVKLFIEPDADDLLAEEEIRRRRAGRSLARPGGRSRAGRLP